MLFAVVTRDGAGAAPYASAFDAVGLEVVAMPVRRIAPPLDEAALAAALARLARYDAVVLTSARAAEACPAGARCARGRSARRRRALAARGVTATVPAGVRDGRGLAEAMAAARAWTGARVLVLRAEDGREDAAAILRAAGAEVDEVIAYRTIGAAPDDPALARARALFAAGEVAVCAVFAPSQLATLIELVGGAAVAATRVVAIGETTAAAARAAGLDAIAAEAPTPEGLAKAVAAVYPRRP